MEEINILMQKLHDIQEFNPLGRITERVAVDIIAKVENTFNMQLILNTEATEYLTPEYLFLSIQDEIIFRSRLKKSEISLIFKVSTEKLEPILSKITEKNQKIIRIDDFYITDSFFQKISEEINEDLLKYSVIFLSDLSMKYEFPMNFMKSFISEKVTKKLIPGHLTNETLISLDFHRNLEAKIKGVVLGSNFPINMTRIRERLNERNIEDEEIRLKIEELIENQTLDGKIIDGVYFHSSFLSKREEILLRIFNENKFLNYQTIRDFSIQNPEKYLKNSNQLSSFPLIFLEEIAISRDFLLNFKELIIETLENEGFLPLEKLLGVPLGSNDCEEVVSERGLGLKEGYSELEMGFLFKGTAVFSILKQIRVKIGGFSKKQQQNMKNIRKIINFETLEKELTESFKGIMEDNEAKEAIMRVIYGRLERDNEDIEDREEKNMGVFFERLAQKVKNALDSFKFTFNCYKSAKNSQFQMENTNTKESLSDRVFNQAINLIEISIFFNCKRFEIEIPENFLFIEEISQINVFAEECQIFKNKDFADQTIEFLPESVGNLVKEAENLVLNEDFQEFFEFLEEKEVEIFGREVSGKEESLGGNYHSPQKQKKKKLQHKKSRSTFC